MTRWPITKWCHFKQLESDGRDDGRDMGEIENISPMLSPLCTKDFPEI